MRTRIDPRTQTNSEDFWVGYGKYQEGIWYDQLPEGADFLAGWCFGMTEGEQEKPWFKSKLLWLGAGSAALSVLGMINPETISQHPRVAASVAIVVSALMAGLRTITKASIK